MTAATDHFPAQVQSLPAFDGPFDAYRLAASGCDVLFATYPAGTSIAPHRHDTDNIGVITKGRLVLTVEGRSSSYGPGDWYHVPEGAEHSAEFAVDSAEIELWFDAAR